MPVFEKIETKGVPVLVFTDQLDAKAREQLIGLAESGIAVGHVAAMPDVHWGLGATVGSVFASEDYICPNAVGVDIGCGMAALPFSDLDYSSLSDISKSEIFNKIKERVPTGHLSHTKPQNDPVLDDNDRSHWLNSQISSKTAKQIGTLGGGNHFLEVVNDESGRVWIMLHSGSRNIGKVTAENYNQLAKTQMKKRGVKPANNELNYLLIESEEGRNYLQDMQWCQRYAYANRQHMLKIMADVISEVTDHEGDWSQAINIHHNYCQCESCTVESAGKTITKDLWITRKGATSAKDGQLGLIPGSMAVGSYIVKGKGNPLSWQSCSHGAGRVLSRKAAIREIKQEDFVASMKGIVCETDPELRDEAPQAYKNLTDVMQWQSDLVEPVNRLSVLINVKGFDRKAQIKKLPAVFLNESDFDLKIDEVEIMVQSKGKRPDSKWIPVSQFELRAEKSQRKTEREIWVKAKNEKRAHLIETRNLPVAADAQKIEIQILGVKKSRKLKL